MSIAPTIAAMSLFEIRREYTGPELREDSAPADPLELFRAWLEEALASPAIEEATAMTLATADSQGKPSARSVLLKQFDERGFVFYTNYNSRKGEDLAANPQAALQFYWEPMHRQVRIEGPVEKTPREESVAYFRTRPRDSQLGAWASDQSGVLPDRAALEARLSEMERHFAGVEFIDPPPHWGGYRLRADVIEFWQGRRSRLHDRLRYTRQKDGTWRMERLAP